MVRAGFGEDVAASKAGIGETVKNAGEVLMGHAIERINQQHEMDVYNGEMDLRNKANKLLFGTDPVTRNINGKNVDVPEGIMNRMGSNAVGAYDEFQSKYQALSSEYVSSYATPQQKRLASYLSQRLNGYYSEQGSRHEAQQRKVQFLSDNNNAMQGVDQLAGQTTDVNQVSELMDQKSRLSNLGFNYQGINPAVEGKKSVEYAKAETLRQSLNKSLMDNRGDPAAAVGILNKLQGKISTDEFERLQQYIPTTSKKISEEISYVQNKDMVQNRLSIVGGLASGSINVMSLDVNTRAAMAQDPELSNAINMAIAKPNPSRIAAGNAENKAWIESAKNILSQTNQKDMSDAILGFVKSGKGVDFEKRLAIMIDVAKDHAKTLPVDGSQTATSAVSPQQSVANTLKSSQVKSGLNEIDRYNKNTKSENAGSNVENFLRLVNGGTSVKDALEQTKQHDFQKRYDGAATMPNVPVLNNVPLSGSSHIPIDYSAKDGKKPTISPGLRITNKPQKKSPSKDGDILGIKNATRFANPTA